MGRKIEVATATMVRKEGLMRMLLERRDELNNDVRGRVRSLRAGGTEHRPHSHPGEQTSLKEDNDVQEDIEIALIQMKAETLNRINEALARLETGRYGFCAECGEEVSEARLRALPFAVRCKDCEEARENALNRQRALAARRADAFGPLFGPA